MGRKLSKEATAFEAATRRHLKESRAIAMLGFELESASRGHAILRLDARARHKQLNKVVHGGILAALADTAGAIAAYTTVPKGVALATIELKINYLEGVPGGRIVAEARVLRTGRNFVVTECEIFDRKGGACRESFAYVRRSGRALAAKVAAVTRRRRLRTLRRLCRRT